MGVFVISKIKVGLSDPKAIKDAKKQLKLLINQLESHINATSFLRRDFEREKIYENIQPAPPTNTENILTNPPESDIIKDGGYTQIPITDKSIERVPLVKPLNFSEDDANALQLRHRELLRIAKEHPIGTECANVLDLSMKPITDTKIGENGNVKLPRCSQPHIVIHNHPSGLTFSITDVFSFAYQRMMQGISAVGNNGSVYMLNKTSEFDEEAFLSYLDSQCRKVIFNGRTYYELIKDKEYISSLSKSDKEKLKAAIIKLSENIIEGGMEYGVLYIKEEAID